MYIFSYAFCHKSKFQREKKTANNLANKKKNTILKTTHVEIAANSLHDSHVRNSYVFIHKKKIFDPATVIV